MVILTNRKVKAVYVSIEVYWILATWNQRVLLIWNARGGGVTQSTFSCTVNDFARSCINYLLGIFLVFFFPISYQPFTYRTHHSVPVVRLLPLGEHVHQTLLQATS